MKIKFRYKDRFTKGNWSYQQCDVGGIEECLRIYGLGEDTEAYEILEVDGKLTKEGKLEKIEKLKADPRVEDLWFDEDLLQFGRDDSVWYGDEVLSFTFKDENGNPRYEVSVIANGDVRICIGDDYAANKNNYAGRVIEFLEEHNIKDDEALKKAEDDGDLYWENNNWFEVTVYDTETGEDLTDGFDYWIIDSPFDLDVSAVLDVINGEGEEEE